MHRATLPRNALFMAAAAAIALAPAAPALAVETTEPIKIVIIDSADADFMAYAYGGILKEFGYNVEFVRIDYSAQVPALETGDLDVTTSYWDVTGWQNILDAVSTGKVDNFGSTGVAVTEGWWYPAYIAEVCPGLPNWEALKSEECVAALSTVETEPRARFIDAPADWETDSQTRLDALQLDFESMSSGSPVTLVATIKAAVDREEPVIGWGYLPHWFYESADGGFVQLPSDDAACFDDASWGPNPDATYDCGFTKGYVWKLGSKDFNDRAPNAARALHLFQVTTADVSIATGRVENDGDRIEDVAAEWVEANREEWSRWLK